MGRLLACLGAAASTALLLSIASCGSRTGLFGPEGIGLLPDGGLPDAEPDAPGPVPCRPGRFDLQLARAQLMFVLDRSGSMAFYLSSDIEAKPPLRRWDYLREALETTIVPLDSQIAMGAKFFPEPLTEEEQYSAERSCSTLAGVGLAPKLGNARTILSVFATTVPRGGTPTAEALQQAAALLAQSRGVARTIVLATDGAPNCNADLDPTRCTCTTPRVDCSINPARGRYSCLDDDRAISTVRDIAEGQRVPVYVIGIGPGTRTEFRHVLDDMAIAGGRPRPTEPRHYNVQTPAEMTAAFTAIRDGVARCTYLTPSSPNDPDAIDVEIDGAPIGRDPSHHDGWDWVDQSYGELSFSGEACEQAQRGGAKITGVVTCGDD